MNLPTEILQLVFRLLPGFFAAWVFYGLTPYRKPNTFERVVQALIFTAVVEGVLWFGKWVLFFLGEVVSLGAWDAGADLPLSILLGLLLGLFCSWLAGNNHLIRWMWRHKLTTSNGYASEWFATFRLEKRFVILNLRDGRRILGWPKEWPDHAGEGHFVLTDAKWLLGEETVPLLEVYKIVLAAADVEFVEFLHEMGATEDPVGERRLRDAPSACWGWIRRALPSRTPGPGPLLQETNQEPTDADRA